MGNYISCTLSIPLPHPSTKATKVIFPSGEIRRIYGPTNAAELMLDAPNSFLVNMKSLRIGKRFSALNADEELQMTSVYVFFPMKRLNEKVAAADMAPLLLAANSWNKRRVPLGCARISPESVADVHVIARGSTEENLLPKLNLDDIEEFSTSEFQHRLSMTRSKKPLLETIVEEPAIRLRSS